MSTIFGLQNTGLLTQPVPEIKVLQDSSGKLLMENNSATLAPLYTMLSANALRNPALVEPKIVWQDNKPMDKLNSLVSNFGNPTGNNFRLAHPGMAQINSFLRVNGTGELMRVTQINGTDISVMRNVGGVGGIKPINCTPTAQVNVLDMGNTSQPEMSGRVNSIQRGKAERDNRFSIIASGYGADGTTMQVLENRDRQGLGGGLRDARNDVVVNHMATLEKALLFNKKAYITIGDTTLSSMNGIFNTIRTNRASPIGGILTDRQLANFLDTVLARGGDTATPSDYLILMSQKLKTMITYAAMDSGLYRFTSSDNFYGLQIDKFVTPNYTFDLYTHPMLTAYGMTGDLVVLRKSDLRLVILREAESDTKVLQEAGLDAAFMGLLTQISLQFTNEHASGRMTGICEFYIPPRAISVVEPRKFAPRTGC